MKGRKTETEETVPFLKEAPARQYLEHAKAARLDASALREEVLEAHKERLAPGLENKKLSHKKIVKVLAREQATRSRVLSIFMETSTAYNALSSMRDAAVMWVMAKKPDVFPVTTKTEQKAYAAHMFNRRTPILEDLKEAKDAAELVMQDIDRAAWNLKAMLSAYELATRPEAFGLS